MRNTQNDNPFCRNTPSLFVYVYSSVCYDPTVYSDYAYGLNDCYPDFVLETQQQEEEDQEGLFAGVADDETHVFTMGRSDIDRSATDSDEDEEGGKYTPSNKSFSQLNDFFDMPPSLPTQDNTHTQTYEPAPYNRSSRIQVGGIFDSNDELTTLVGTKFIEDGFKSYTQSPTKPDTKLYVREKIVIKGCTRGPWALKEGCFRLESCTTNSLIEDATESQP